LFLIASGCRFVSAALLAAQSEPEPPDQHHREVPVRELLRRFRHGRDGRLLMYMLITQAAVQISGPYFTPYMLGQIKMSYASFLLLIATAYSGRILFLPFLGALARRVGAQRVLWFAGWSIVPLSAMWLVSSSITYLFFVQLIAGSVWAAYELATFLLLFETIAEQERTSVLTTFNLGHAFATVVGAAIGGMVLKMLGTDHMAYMAVFAASCGARLFTIPLLGRAARAIAPAAQTAEPVPTRVLAVRPNLGAIDGPILTNAPQRSTVSAQSPG